MAKGLLIAAMNFSDVAEDEFHDWYDTEHIPERLAVPGFINADRWIGIDNSKVSVATYDLDAVGVLHSAPYNAVGGANGSPWTKRVTGRVGHIIRLEGDQILPGDGLAPRGAAQLLVVSMNPVSEAEAEFNAWYNEEHLPALASVPGVLMARRYRGQGATQRYLAMYHFVRPDVRDGDAWKKAANTPWTEKMRPHFRDYLRLDCRPYKRAGVVSMADQAASGGKPLPAALLRRVCTRDELPFQLSSELADAPAMIGQERAAEAIEFALKMRRKGYNVYALGPAGSGRHELVEELLRRRAATEPTPPDWCYVNNFADTQKPRFLELPAGQGAGLAGAMKHLIDELRIALPAAFERDEYRARREVVDQQAKAHSEAGFGGLRQRAEAKGITLIRTPMGLAVAPKHDGKVMNPEDFEALPEAERKRIESDLEAAQAELEGIMRQVPQWEREHRDALRELNRDTTGFAVASLIGDLRKEYADLPDVLDYLDSVERDIKENVDDFLSQPGQPPQQQGTESGGPPPPPGAPAAMEDMRFRRYQVNVVVDNGSRQGGPVIYEDNPTFPNLVGRVEHLARFGALITDFNLILAGALHRANGGYLILDAERLLAGYGWPALKRGLQSGEIRIETLEQALSAASTVTLQPEPIPLEVKVVLVGSPLLYYMLSSRDDDFAELFKIAADFDDRIPRNGDATLLYARVIATIVRRDHLRAFDRDAVARVIEQAARLAGDSERLSTSMRAIFELLQEADQLAADADEEIVGATEVQGAIDAQIRRGDRIYRRMQEEIGRRTIRIETSGAAVGQINGLSVISLGALAFGNPTRITAQVRMGRGEVVDIEREVQLGGPLHSKGVLILAGFLGGRFGATRPLSLHASLVFEQSYGGVDGDSASAAELFALLSALAGVPIRQCFAVTGSVDQHGIIQAIGGVNEKIEGFFDVCSAAGLTGEQGCIIPASNVKHLMLRADVVAAAEAGRFRVIPMETIDQGFEILTGVASDVTNEKIAARLDGFAAKAAALMRSQAGPS